MSNVGDEFKDAGTYFDEHRWVELPGFDLSGEFTILAWFIWMSGSGPLYFSENEQLAFGYDKGGLLAYRLAGAERVTTTTVASLRDRWIMAAVSRIGTDAVVRIDSGIADHWPSAPPLAAGISKLIVMKNAVGFAADVAYWDGGYVTDERLDVLWNLGKDRV